jgi:cytochrome c-type biogenesis protein CcmH/NrfG
VGDLPDAERYLRKAIAISPADAAEHRYLGFTLLEQKKNDEAEKALRIAIQLDPKTREQHFALGTILEERNDLEGALKEFE